MTPIRVPLPERLDFGGIQATVLQLDSIDHPQPHPGIVFDMGAVKWTEPVGIVGLACLVEGQRRQGRNVSLDHSKCSIAGYWERMGFFREVDLPGPPNFNAINPAAGRFAEVRKIHRIDDVDDLSADIAACLDLEEGSEEWRMVLHIISEALNNVCQHSGSQGFCAAQFWPKQDRLQIAIADFGVGLKFALTRYNPADDAAALDLALQVGITGRPPNFGQPGMRNRGVGLTCIDRLARANSGRLDLWSGLGRKSSSSPEAFNANIRWTGTLLMANIARSGIRANFRAVMAELQDELYAAEKARKPRASV